MRMHHSAVQSCLREEGVEGRRHPARFVHDVSNHQLEPCASETPCPGASNGSNPRLATERTRGVRAVTVIGMPRRIPVVEGGVEQANFPVFWARDADVVQTGTEDA